MSVKFIAMQAEEKKKKQYCLVSPGSTKLQFFFFKGTKFLSSHDFKKEINTPAIPSPLFLLQGTSGVSSSISPCLQLLVGRCLPSSPLLGKRTSKAPALTGMNSPGSGELAFPLLPQ